MKLSKLAIIFIVALATGALSKFLDVKFNWTTQHARNQRLEVREVQREEETEQAAQAELVWTMPAGVSVSPQASALLDAAPAEVAVTFPFKPRAGDLVVNYNDADLTQPGDDLIIRGNAFVYPLPTSAASGVYTVKYSACPAAGADNGCINGTYGFAVK